MENIGFNDDDIIELMKNKKIASQIGCLSYDAREIVKKLKKNDAFIEIYDGLRLKQKRLFRQYLEQEGIVKKTKRIAVVDAGWKGTIQDNIWKALDGAVEIYGYYIGYLGMAKTQSTNLKNGLIFTKMPVESKYYDIWSFDHTFMERLLTASHPTTQSYEIDEHGIVMPLLKAFDSEVGIYDRLKNLRESIFLKFEKLCEVFENSCYFPEIYEDIFAKEHARTIWLVNRSELRLQKDLLNAQYENFGYNKSGGEHLKQAYTFSNVIKKMKQGAYLNCLRKISGLMIHKQCYFGVKIIYFIRYLKKAK